jgi:peptidoglycan hydrolase-like protein with peptidoglycan-binding domain
VIRPLTALVASLLSIGLLVAVVQFARDSGSEPSPVAVAAPTTASPTTPVAPTTTIGPDCSMSIRLDLGVTDPEVECLELRLAAAGMFDGEPDEVFDELTDASVRAFQDANDLLADGIAGPVTARLLGNWIGGDLVPPDPDTCAPTGRSAVVDRDHQRAWLCADGSVTHDMPMTSAISQPEPGTYEVYAKDRNAASSPGRP